MFFFIPFGILVLAVGGIVWLVSRKFSYLRKLAPDTLAEAVESRGNFWVEMYPELTAYLRRINLRAYGVNLLNEFEKTLRKLRLVSLKIDSQTNQLIHRVRQSSKKQEAILSEEAKREEVRLAEEEEDIGYEELGNRPEELKQKEQLLIIEIAKHPKDALLYKELGVVYMRLAEWGDARQSFETAIVLDPTDEGIKRKLGRVLGK